MTTTMQFLLIVAVSVSLIFIAAGIAISFSYSDWSKREDKQQTSTRDHHLPAAHHNEEEATLRANNVEPQTADDYRKGDETHFQQRQLNIGIGLNIVTAVGVVAGIVVLIVLIDTFNAQKVATNVVQ